MTSRFLPRSLSAGALLSFALGLSSSSAHAQGVLDLAWEAPEECPSGLSVSKQVRSLAGDSSGGSPWQATGRIERRGARYQLTLTLRRGNEIRERKMESTSCEDLAGAAAVALGLLLRKEQPPPSSATDGAAAGPTGSHTGDSHTGDATSTPAPASTDKRAAAVAQKPGAVSPEETDVHSRQRRWNVLVRAPFGTGAWGQLSRPALALGGGLGFRYDDWRVTAQGRIFEDTALWSEVLPSIGTTVKRMAADITGCREWRANRFAFGPCLTVGVSFFRARGKGPHVIAQSRRVGVAALGAGADARVLLTSWLAAFGDATVAAETSRPALSITEFGEVTRLGPVDFSLTLGGEWIF